MIQQLNLAAKDDAAKGDDDDADPQGDQEGQGPQAGQEGLQGHPPKKVSIGRVGSPEVSSL